MFPWVSRLTKSKKSMPELRRSSLSFQRSAKSPGRVMLLSPSLVWKWNGSSKWMTMVRRSSVLRDSAARAASFRGVSNMCAAVIGVGGRVLGELSESVEGVDAVEDEDEPDGFAERGVASGCRTGLEPKMSLCVKFPSSHRTHPGTAHVLSVFSPFTDRTATAAVARLKLCEFDIRGMLERSDVPISLCRQMTLVSCQISWMCETSRRGTQWEPVDIVVLILIFILICSFHLHPHLHLTLRQQGSMCAAHDSLPRCGHTHGTPCNAPPATLHRTTTPGTVPTLSTNLLNPLQKNTTWKTTAQKRRHLSSVELDRHHPQNCWCLGSAGESVDKTRGRGRCQSQQKFWENHGQQCDLSSIELDCSQCRHGRCLFKSASVDRVDMDRELTAVSSFSTEIQDRGTTSESLGLGALPY